ncbi:putative TRAG family protein [Hyphomicrobium sp. GJ21]|nr:putative TRAG family protein [Hyphomicrobium sp. GJ21]
MASPREASFVDQVSRLAETPHAVLRVPATALLHADGTHRLHQYVRAHFKGIKPSLAGTLGKMAIGVLTRSPNSIGDAIAHTSKDIAYHAKVMATMKLLAQFDLARPVLSLSEQEKKILTGMASIAASGHCSYEEWSMFLAQLAWNGGKCHIEPHDGMHGHARHGEIRQLLTQYLNSHYPVHDIVLASAGQRVADAQDEIARTRDMESRKRDATRRVLKEAPAVLNPGAHWMTDEELATAPGYATRKTDTSLLIGVTEGGKAVYYNGHESLMTIGGPGTGKSQAHAVTNLLRYPGSAVVLDVKDDELWKQTAEYRRRRFGPVFRFAPTDFTGSSHGYNPFDFISTDPDRAAHDCFVFSYQTILPNPKAHDPYWENKGRDFVWAYAMLVALEEKGPDRSIETLYRYFMHPIDDEPDSEILAIAQRLVMLGKIHDIPDLEGAGNALQSGIALQSKALESVLDTARSNLSSFAKSMTARRAMSRTDWRPSDLRKHQGATLYICLSADDLKSYGAMIRIMLAQHLAQLQNYSAKPDEPPITFFLDEMPKLGNFQSILNMQDLGRSAGLRLWMFCQYIGQLEQCFFERYKGVIDACRVRSFMRPDGQAYEHIRPALGETRNLFSGERAPLASSSDLMGRAFRDKILVLTSGENPMSLGKVLAYKNYTKRMLPPPTIKPMSRA